MPLNQAHIHLFELFFKKCLFSFFALAGFVRDAVVCFRRRVGVIDVCRQQVQRTERLSEGLWACSSLYEQIKSVKCHGLIKAGGGFWYPVFLYRGDKENQMKMMSVSSSLWVRAEQSEEKPTTRSFNG